MGYLVSFIFTKNIRISLFSILLLINILESTDVNANGFEKSEKNIEVQKKSLFEKRSLSSADGLSSSASLSTIEIEKNLEKFKLAKQFYDQKKYVEALPLFKELSELPHFDLQDYAQYYLSQSYVLINNADEAEKSLKKLEELKPNLRLQTLANESLGLLYLDQKKFKESLHHFVGLEKKTRNTETYPEVIYHLARAEKGLGKKIPMCQWLLKLYEKYPQYVAINTWGSDLTENSFEGSPTGCSFDLENFKTRMKNLSLSGQLQKSLGEIEQLKKRGQLLDSFPMDQLEALYHMYDGNPQKAQEILKASFEKKKRDISFLQLYGSAAARAGDYQMAVGIYYQIFKLAPKAKSASQALYQSAMLSYQFQDYDGASRKFKEFIGSFPGSQNVKDADWHLAWLKYLRGDYLSSFKDLNRIKDKKYRTRRNVKDEKVTYWMAMNLLRMEKYQESKTIFENLAKDKLFGFYSLASQARLKVVNEKMALLKNVTKIPDQPTRYNRFDVNEYLMPSIEGLLLSSGINSEDPEDSLSVAGLYLDDEAETAESISEDNLEDNPDQQQINVVGGEVILPSFEKDPKILQKFEKARDLLNLGMADFARWDLFEIEKTTRNREYLKILMNEYAALEHFHRSSYIAQTTFSGDRLRYGIEGARAMWQFAFPTAFANSVKMYSEKYNVPQEFIWGIMRAESQYKKEAISPVGALGLMQVMPYTGEKISRLLGEKDFKADSLLTPEGAIKYGSRYLSRLLDQNNQLIPLAAAAYNGGPHRVQNWLSSFGFLDMDEFIEHIPFLETRNYVKKVISFAAVYRQLYGNKENIFPYLASEISIEIPKTHSAKENWNDVL